MRIFLIRRLALSVCCLLLVFGLQALNITTPIVTAQCIFGLDENCVLDDEDDDAPVEDSEESSSDDDSDDENVPDVDEQTNDDEDDDDVVEDVAETAEASTTEGSPVLTPEITRVVFPDKVNVRTVGSGIIHYNGAQNGTARLIFDVVDGRYQQATFNAVRDTEAGSIRFSLQCTDYAQQLKLRVSVQDQAGNLSQPQLLKFNCGQPRLFNLSDELADPGQQVEEKARVHVFVIHDGTTRLSDNFIATDDAALSLLDPSIENGVRQTMLNGVNGIWDQCGFGFELGLVNVLHPQQLDAYTLRVNAADPFTPMSRSVYIPATGQTILSTLKHSVYQHLLNQTEMVRQDDLMVFVTGKSILVEQFPGTSDSWNNAAQVEGVSDMIGVRSTLVRWGALFENEPGQFVLPRQVTSTLAHELGHLISLQHPGEDGLSETVRDQYNLMKGSGVTPEPRANLLPSQCRQATDGTEHLRQIADNVAQADEGRTPTQTEASDPVSEEPEDGPTVSFLNLRQREHVTGTLMLEVVTDGFEALDRFGMAEFAYAKEGEALREIGIDRDPADGFSMAWDTTLVENGHYLLRVTVRDGARLRASAQIWVRVSNGLIVDVDVDARQKHNQFEAPPPTH